MLSLNELWFVLVAVLFIGFFFLEGFDFGVRMSTRTLAKMIQRRVLINSIGPFWDANEVWADGGRRHVRRFPELVCDAVQRLLHSACLSSAGLDRTRGGL